MLVGLCGRARVGKSTSAAILAKWGYRRVAFAAALKDVISRVFAPGTAMIDEMKSEVCPLPVEDGGIEQMVTYGRLMQLVGQGMRKALGDSVWVRSLFDYEVVPTLAAGHPVVIEDVRFPQEATAIWLSGGVIIRLTRVGTDTKSMRLPDGRDPREEDVTGVIQVDAEVSNDGSVEELEEKLMIALRSVRR